MAYSACDGDDLIEAPEAEQGKVYYCLECFGPVKKRRRGRNSLSDHFYHTQSSPKCRLYSKTEDHFRAQIQLQKSFPPGALTLEKPFINVNRVADVCWEKEKIVFEIQCSPLTEKEAEMRIRDYRTCGYDVVWLLDDKRYNKRVIRPAEEFLRKNCAYYVSIKRGLFSDYYDQFEIFSQNQRVKKGGKMPISLEKISKTPNLLFKNPSFPNQIHALIPNCPIYFKGDRLHKAILAHRYESAAISMQNWRALEIRFARATGKISKLKRFIRQLLINPYLEILDYLIRRVR